MSYNEAKKKYAKLGIDTEKAIKALAKVPVALHLWQGNDVEMFDVKPGGVSGGIQATGNYPGRARNPQELMDDLAKVLSLCPGKKRINLHMGHAVFKPGEWVDRDKTPVKAFKPWVDFCKKHKVGADLNPTYFGHPMNDPLSLTSPNPKVRRFWIEHTKRALEVGEYLAKELKSPCLVNVWIGDGLKDIPGDRLGPRLRYKESLDTVLKEHPLDQKKTVMTVEAKLFGIGAETYTPGSGEFCLKYASENKKKGVVVLMDTGHYHPTEVVSDKVSSILAFDEKMALHVSRPVRWDSDHVVSFDDETRELAREIVRCGADRFYISLDYFDASINRIAAWVNGFRNFQKAMLFAFLQPVKTLKKLQDTQDFTQLQVLQEELKLYPFGDVWEEYCKKFGLKADESWLDDVCKYEKEVLAKRKERGNP